MSNKDQLVSRDFKILEAQQDLIETLPLTVASNDRKYIVASRYGVLRPEGVANWETTLATYKSTLHHISEYPTVDDGVVNIPTILEVVKAPEPPKRFIPQLKRNPKVERAPVTGWFHHPKPAKESSGVIIDFDEGWEPVHADPALCLVGCVACNLEIQSTVNTIRARVFETLIKMEKEIGVDATTGDPLIGVVTIPRYKTGRLCKVCQSTLNGISGRPPRRGEFEYLNERVGARKRRSVTAGAMKAFDIAARKQRDEDAKKYIDLGDVLVEVEPEVPEPIDVSAYRALHRMNRSKSKGRRDDLVDFNERKR